MILLWGAMVVYVGIPWRTVGIIIVIGMVVAFGAWHSLLADYQKNRLLTFVDPTSDPLGAGYNVTQSIVALGSGGFLGRGLGHGPQSQLKFLPERHTDFILASVGEELGFVGVFVALVLFLTLLLVLLRISRRAIDPFASLMAFGVLGLFFTHVFENVGMTVNLMPITGIPLPFFSYGGSFLLTSAIGIGLAMRVAWDSRFAGYVDT